MANHVLKRLTYDGKPIIAEAAYRDSYGNIIPDTYATKEECFIGTQLPIEQAITFNNNLVELKYGSFVITEGGMCIASFVVRAKQALSIDGNHIGVIRNEYLPKSYLFGQCSSLENGMMFCRIDTDGTIRIYSGGAGTGDWQWKTITFTYPIKLWKYIRLNADMTWYEWVDGTMEAGQKGYFTYNIAYPLETVAYCNKFERNERAWGGYPLGFNFHGSYTSFNVLTKDYPTVSDWIEFITNNEVYLIIKE